MKAQSGEAEEGTGEQGSKEGVTATSVPGNSDTAVRGFLARVY